MMSGSRCDPVDDLHPVVNAQTLKPLGQIPSVQDDMAGRVM